jgi:inosine-uridine nucleoside N-ribohydrolase
MNKNIIKRRFTRQSHELLLFLYFIGLCILASHSQAKSNEPVANQNNPTVENPRRIILDVDPGIDDALAILMAFQSPELQIEAMTVTQGNVPVDVGIENALKIASLAERDNLIVAKGASTPLFRGLITAELIHGDYGLGTASLPATNKLMDDRHAVDVIIDIVNQNPGEITLVPVGPLTNIALVLLKDPDIAEKIPEIILMGGAVATGNMTPVAEANIYHDAEAAKIVFASGIPITMVGLDVTHQTLLTEKHKNQLGKSNSKLAKFASEVSDHYLKITNEFFNGKGVALHDPLAIAIAIDKTLVTDMRPMYIDVETKGELTYGQTVANRMLITESAELRDGRLVLTRFGTVKANVDVPMVVEADRAVEMFMQRLLANPR